MKTLKTLSALLMMLFFMGSVWAQDADRLNEVKELVGDADKEGWSYGVGAGLDFFQLLQINPKVGSGEDRIQFGGVGSAFAKYKKGRLTWLNTGGLLFGVQKLGIGTQDIIAYQKTVDELRLNSMVSFKHREDSKWSFYSGDLTFVSQVTPTYPGNYLKNIDPDNIDGPIAKFLSPAKITFAPGISYTPNDNFGVLFSPIGMQAIVVADDAIASIPGDAALNVGLHGTEWNSPTDYKKTLFQLGAMVKARYDNKFFNDKIIYSSELTLFSNYLNKPKNIDIDFRNQIAYEIWKGLQLTFTLNFFYDDDIPVQITDRNAPQGVKLNDDGSLALGRRLNVLETFALKYNIVF